MNPFIIFAIAALLFGGGSFLKDTGEAVDTTANATLKLIAALALSYFLLKKTKVI